MLRIEKGFYFLFVMFVGVGGNLVAVQASRLATSLHKQVSLGTLPDSTRYGCIRTFCTGGKFCERNPGFYEKHYKTVHC